MPISKNSKRICYPFAVLYYRLHGFCIKFRRVMLDIINENNMIKCGDGLRFDSISSYITYDKISIGKNVYLGHSIDIRGLLSVGDHVMFGPYVYITDGRHDYEQVGKYIIDQGSVKKQCVHIEDDCWIGARSMIMCGVTIGEGVIVGGMSVVISDLPVYTVCGGNSCKPIKKSYADKNFMSITEF